MLQVLSAENKAKFRMHLCKNCVHRVFPQLLQGQRELQGGGEVCLTTLFNLFGEKRKGAERAPLRKQLTSLVFLLLGKVKTDI